MAEELLSSIVWLALIVTWFGGMWKSFAKAGRPGWAALIPFVNTYYILKIGDNPSWHFLLLFVPLLNFFIALGMHIDFAKAYGKGILWGLGLFFLPFVFFPLLGFGGYTYQSGSKTARSPTAR